MTALQATLFVFITFFLQNYAIQYSDGFVSVGYIPEWRYGGMDWDAISKYLTHIILFSLEIDQNAEITALDRKPPKEMNDNILAATKKHNTKVLICFGGYGRSNGLPVVAIDPKLRAKLIVNIIKLLDENEYDGVDMNWEYPQTGAEWQGLFSLLRELRVELDKKGRVLTMATYPGQEAGLPKAAVDQLDYVLTMSYDNMCSHPKRKPPCHHSTMSFAEWTIEQVKPTNIPLNKFCLGVPFYARQGYSGDWLTFYDILKEEPELREKTSVDIAKKLYYFNNVDTIKAKTALAMKAGLAGIMIWEVGQDVHADDPNSLLKAIDTVWREKHPQEHVQDEL